MTAPPLRTSDAPGRLVDLDQRETPPSPTRRRRPYRIAVVVAALLGAGIGAAAQTASQRTPPAGAQLVVTLQLRDVVLEDDPTAVLDLRMENLGDQRETAVDVSLRGAGLVPRTLALGLSVWPGSPDVVPLRVPLTCARGHRPGDPAEALVQLASDGPGGADGLQGPHTVAAVPIGTLGDPGGLCAAADAALPRGWSEPARATAHSFAPDRSLHLTVDGLPADVTEVVSVDADGAPVPMDGAPAAVRGGRTTLVLARATVGCRSGDGRPIFPTGLQLFVQGQEGARSSYLPVGTDVAAWLLPALSATCPDGPNGTSAVRTDFPR